MSELYQERLYRRSEVASFRKTKELFGGLSNMSAGYPIVINDVFIRTSEALYQACRFPHRLEVQRLIIQQKSPMSAKMKSKPYRADSRQDWDSVRVMIMRWCIRVKLAQNWTSFAELLLSTGTGPIVEESIHDAFWGARPVGPDTLKGVNVLGRLLRQLRDQLLGADAVSLYTVSPPQISDFLLYGVPVGSIHAHGFDSLPPAARKEGRVIAESMEIVGRNCNQEVVASGRQIAESDDPDWEVDPLPPDDLPGPAQASFQADGFEASSLPTVRRSRGNVTGTRARRSKMRPST